MINPENLESLREYCRDETAFQQLQQTILRWQEPSPPKSSEPISGDAGGSPKVLIDQVPNIVCRLDRNFRHIDVNSAVEPVTGISRQNFLGKTKAELGIPQHLADLWQDQLRKVFSTRQIAALELDYPLNSGIKTYKTFIVPELSADGSVESVITISEDVTEQRQKDLALRQADERFQLVAAAVNCSIYDWNVVQNQVRRTQGLLWVVGFTPEEAEPTVDWWMNRIHPQDRPYVEMAVSSALMSRQDYVLEYRIRDRQGQYRWVGDRGVIVRNESGRAMRVVGSCLDVHDLKQNQWQLQQQIERDRLFRKLTLHIHQSLELGELLAVITAEIRQFLWADRVLISRRNAQGDLVVIGESIAEGCTSALGSVLQQEWYVHRLPQYLQGEARVVADLEQTECPQDIKKFLQRLQVRAFLAVPVVQGGELWGLLAVHQCAKPHTWKASEVDLLGRLATQLAIAVQRSELYQNIQALNTNLERQVQERTALLQQTLEFEAMLKRTTDKVRDSLDEHHILQVAVTELAQVLQVDCCDASIYDLEHQQAVVQYEHTQTLPSLRGTVRPIQSFLNEYRQLCDGQHYQICPLSPMGPRPSTAQLICPIKHEQGVLGNLGLYKAQEQSFQESEIRLVQQVANQCAIALRQARLYQTARTQVQQLEQLNQLKDDFLSTVSHELRTPVANMKMAIQMLKLAPLDDRFRRYLEILQSECTREIELINDLLDLQRLEAEAYPIFLVEAIHLNEWLPGLVAPFLTRIQMHQQHFQLGCSPALPLLVSDRGGLTRILSELLNNACKYTPAEGQIVLEVEYVDPSVTPEQAIGEGSTLPAYFLITLSNQGEIPADSLPYIFDKFYRVPNADPWKQGGTGLGLALVQKLTTQLKGTIQVESQDGWTRFLLRLPINPQSSSG